MEPKGALATKFQATPESPPCLFHELVEGQAGNRQKSSTTYNPHVSSTPEYVSKYTQLFSFDAAGFGNMTVKKSTESVRPHRKLGDGLNYTFDYEYDSEKYAHRLLRAGDRRYEYDANGNIVLEHDGENADAGDGGRSHKINEEADNVYSTDYGWGLFRDTRNGVAKNARHRRYYTWNEKNQLVSSSDAQYTVNYVYGQDGQRAAKYTAQSETLYFNKMWTLHTDGGNSHLGGEYAKNVYLGETRIVTKLVSANEIGAWEEVNKIYFYHSDHLGSASLITDENGNEYQRLEYTPYGEVWVDKYSQIQESTALLPYKFTGKERDEETGLYYYGARYLDAKYSRWISTDPALGEYIPAAGKGTADGAGKLPGIGGAFNSVNLNLYHYAGNNPVRYTDPDGNYIINNALLGDKTKTFAIQAGTNSWYLNGGYLPTIFSDSKSNYPGFPQFSVFEKNIGFTQTLEKALNIADRFKNDNDSRTEAKVTAKAKLKENGVYEISVTVSTNLSARDITGVVAYAGENEIMTDGKIDQAKVDKIANNSINTVMEWKNEKKNID